MRYAYLHGFASDSTSSKGIILARHFEAYGQTLLRPDLNRPSFQKLTYTACLESLDALDRGAGEGPWCLIGSSLGGYLAALWAQKNPTRVHRLVLLAPAFGMIDRWPDRMGAEAFRLWEKNNAFFFPDAKGEPAPVHFGLIEDARTHPRFPVVPCPTLIFHGREDETVPIEFSRQYAADHPGVELVEVNDDHILTASVEQIGLSAVRFFGLV